MLYGHTQHSILGRQVVRMGGAWNWNCPVASFGICSFEPLEFSTIVLEINGFATSDGMQTDSSSYRRSADHMENETQADR